MTKSKFILLYFVITIILIIDIVLSFYKLSLSGYYSDKVIVWTWIALTLIGIIWLWKFKIVKLYVGLLLSILFLSILPMALPFFGIIYFSSTIDDYQQIQLNEKFRIEKTKPGALDSVKIIIYERNGIFEREVSRISFSEILDKLNLNNENILIQNAKIINLEKGTISISYSLENKSVIFRHKLNKQSNIAQPHSNL